MEIICKGRCTGKTTQLIKHAANNRCPILVCTENERRYVNQRILEMYKEKMIPIFNIDVILPSELRNYGNDIKVNVDNAEYLLCKVLEVEVETMTINAENLIPDEENNNDGI